MPHLSDQYLVETLFSGRVRLVTPEGEVFVSNGRPDADKVLAYLDRGYGPKGSAKWTFAGQASHEDRLRIADRFAASGRFGGFRGGCENCDGEGDHDPSVPCGCPHTLCSRGAGGVWRCIDCDEVAEVG